MAPAAKHSKMWQLYDFKQRIVSVTAVRFEQCPSTEKDDTPNYEEWCAQQAERNVHFDKISGSKFCHCRSCLFCVCYIQEGNFDLYLQSLAQIMQWMSVLYQTHYSRWLSVHIRDTMSLSVNHPNIRAEFCAGKIVAHKTSHKFSAMVID